MQVLCSDAARNDSFRGSPDAGTGGYLGDGMGWRKEQKLRSMTIISWGSNDEQVLRTLVGHQGIVSVFAGPVCSQKVAHWRIGNETVRIS